MAYGENALELTVDQIELADYNGLVFVTVDFMDYATVTSNLFACGGGGCLIRFKVTSADFIVASDNGHAATFNLYSHYCGTHSLLGSCHIMLSQLLTGFSSL